MPAFITGNDTDTANNNNDSNMNNNGFLITIQVIFSVLVFFIFAFCMFTGIRKRKKENQRRQMMVEHAIIQQERRYQLHLQGQCHSSSTIAHFTTITCPPPSYSPPDSRYSLPQDAISRLDYLLLQNQSCTKPQ
jgi:hypothetical protein